MTKLTALCVLIAAVLPISAASAASGSSDRVTVAATTYKSALTPQERGAAIGTFVRTWGPYVQQVYGLDVATWSQRMVPQFAVADATNIQRALARTTFEGATAELSGAGHKMSDSKAISTLASLSSGGAQPLLPEVLGSLTNDLVFTPVVPCRIVDTRLAGGAIAANTNRGFYVWGPANYVAQGGSNTNCGLNGQSPEAVVVNVTVVTPAAGGYATVYPANAVSVPLSASVNYAGGDIVNNSVTTPIGVSGLSDFRIYTWATANYVVDIVGYYDAPYATALDCVDVPGAATAITASGNLGLSAPACAAGYTKAAVTCDSSSYKVVNAGFNSGTCYFTNLEAVAHTATAASRCCRVPGR